MKQILKKLLLITTLFAHSTTHPLKLDRVILASDDNQKYLEFWPLVAKAWKEIVGITPTLALITDKEITVDETLGDVIHISPIEGVPTGLHAQVIRLLLPAYFPDDVCILSDIDMLPMQKDYFHDAVAAAPDDAFVVYRHYLESEHGHQLPICYVAAKGQTFIDVFKLPGTQYIPTVIKHWHSLNLGWTTDELALPTYIDKWKEKETRLITLNHTGEKRVDRSFWYYEKDRVKKHDYIDAHLPRPYSQHKEDLDTLADLLGLSDSVQIERMKDVQTHPTTLRANGKQQDSFVLSEAKQSGAKSNVSKRVVPDQKHFEIVIPSYNNERWCIANIKSALTQEYTNFHIFYVDDASTDNTGDLVAKYIQKNNLQEKVTLIRNKTRAGCPLANFYKVIHQCDDQSIIVQLDGDDFLAHGHVLSKLNSVYADENVWMTYGSYKGWPVNTPENYSQQLPDEVIQRNGYRRYPWRTSHLRTNYSWLFKQIRYEDFLIAPNCFYPMSGDQAIMFPMLELSGFHSRFIPEVLLTYNLNNPLGEHVIDVQLQISVGQHIRNQTSYTPLTQAATGSDLIVFSYDRPLQLYAFLESARKYLTGINRTHVIYRTSDESYETAYEKVRNAFEYVTFVRQTDPPHDFTMLTQNALSKYSSNYVIFAVDDIIITDYINVANCVQMLENSNAYGFYLRLGKNITNLVFGKFKLTLPQLYPIETDVIGWSFPQTYLETTHPWAYPHSVDLNVFPKKQITKLLNSINYNSPNTLEGNLYPIPAIGKVGLCFNHSRMVNIPLNCVQDEFENPQLNVPKELLLDIFDRGAKIDIAPLHQYNSTSPHIMYKPELVVR